jgi:hypothetical protein
LFIHAQLSWSKSLVRKWFNIKTKAQDFHADCDAAQGNATLGMFAEWNFRHPALDVSRITRFSGLVPRFHSEKDTLPANMSRSDTATFSLCSWYWSLSPSDADVCLLLLGIFVSFSSHGVFTCLSFHFHFRDSSSAQTDSSKWLLPLHLLHFVCLG